MQNLIFINVIRMVLIRSMKCKTTVNNNQGITLIIFCLFTGPLRRVQPWRRCGDWQFKTVVDSVIESEIESIVMLLNIQNAYFSPQMFI